MEFCLKTGIFLEYLMTAKCLQRLKFSVLCSFSSLVNEELRNRLTLECLILTPPLTEDSQCKHLKNT